MVTFALGLFFLLFASVPFCEPGLRKGDWAERNWVVLLASNPLIPVLFAVVVFLWATVATVILFLSLELLGWAEFGLVP